MTFTKIRITLFYHPQSLWTSKCDPCQTPFRQNYQQVKYLSRLRLRLGWTCLWYCNYYCSTFCRINKSPIASLCRLCSDAASMQKYLLRSLILMGMWQIPHPITNGPYVARNQVPWLLASHLQQQRALYLLSVMHPAAQPYSIKRLLLPGCMIKKEMKVSLVAANGKV